MVRGADAIRTKMSRIHNTGSLSYEKDWGTKIRCDIEGNGNLLDQDLFFLQRHQMLVHHEKELDHLKRMMERKEEELIKNQVRKTQKLMKVTGSDAESYR